MEAVGAASVILGIATAGLQCSLKLMTFAGQVKIAPEQIGIVAEDVSLIANILKQLGELVKQNIEYKGVSDDNGYSNTNKNIAWVHDIDTTISKKSIFIAPGLEKVIGLARQGETIFELLNQSLHKASQQLHENSETSDKVKSAETFELPVLFPEIVTMHFELRNIKGKLILMLQVAMLVYSRSMLESNGESQPSTDIVAFSREEQELLVQSIVAAQESQIGSPGKEDTEASNVESVRESLEEERPPLSQYLRASKRILPSVHTELNGTADHAGKIPLSRQPTRSASEIFDQPPLHVFKIYLVSPRVSITDRQLHISYDARIINLQNLTIESQLQEWKRASNKTVLDQLAALQNNEFEALDATRNSSDGTIPDEGILEWIQFGDYRTLVQGIETSRARTLTIIMSKVPQPAPQLKEETKKSEIEEGAKDESQKGARTTWIKVHKKHLSPETLISFGLPWDWDQSDPHYLIIKTWITEDFQEELFAHTRRLRHTRRPREDNKTQVTTQVTKVTPKAEAIDPKAKVNDPKKDRIIYVRKKTSKRRSRKKSLPQQNSGFMSWIRQSIPFFRQRKQDRKQEQGDTEQKSNNKAQAGKIESSNPSNRTAVGEEREEISGNIEEEEQEVGQQAEEEPEVGEEVEALSESDDAEDIVDDILTRHSI
ncbi:Glucose-methanol-choline oxidoreductase N-terminal [Penicillium pulvis]|uniref:Glucose-methanol-choline oxidoreductase N-terminal n=1 Tax=Penicillium pulvis TaxID=1562058 RepID=UPI002546910E|nr:Glucose-methanol-choline oxidoreductase N-terminal [Penicillium pulvis]KAJ5785313.1 Glucose-methanol-choline oxidoreductase N-terminal [Penicillium pulvis]